MAIEVSGDDGCHFAQKAVDLLEREESSRRRAKRARSSRFSIGVVVVKWSSEVKVDGGIRRVGNWLY